MRVDKFLWCVRLFKTRSIATKACNGERVKVQDHLAKSSKEVKVGDVVQIKATPIWRSFKVLDIPKSRVGAKLVPDLVVETTSPEDLDLYHETLDMNRTNRTFGIKGRPTKKTRRNMDDFLDW